MEEFMNLIELCRSGKVFIQTHNFPDPDAIASAYGLQALLAYFSVPSVICYHGKIDKLSTRKMTELFHIAMFPSGEVEKEMTKDDFIICVDSQKGGGNILDLGGNEIACIDHHPTYVQASYRYADIRMVGSCATLIAEYFQRLDVPMVPDVATALLYGLKTDTAHFTRGVTVLDIDMFRYLFPQIDAEKMTDLVKNTLEFQDLKAYGSAIENIHVYDKVGIAAIPFECPDSLIALVADFILSLEEVEIAVIYSYRPEEIKFSVRSESSVHAGELIHQALDGLGSGGGHAEMAGGTISREKIGLLGAYPDDTISGLFLNAIAEAGKRKSDFLAHTQEERQ